jgi:hypothetical protein
MNQQRWTDQMRPIRSSIADVIPRSCPIAANTTATSQEGAGYLAVRYGARAGSILPTMAACEGFRRESRLELTRKMS